MTFLPFSVMSTHWPNDSGQPGPDERVAQSSSLPLGQDRWGCIIRRFILGHNHDILEITHIECINQCACMFLCCNGEESIDKALALKLIDPFNNNNHHIISHNNSTIQFVTYLCSFIITEIGCHILCFPLRVDWIVLVQSCENRIQFPIDDHVSI